MLRLLALQQHRRTFQAIRGFSSSSSIRTVRDILDEKRGYRTGEGNVLVFSRINKRQERQD